MEVATARGDIRAKSVVVATGPFQAPKIPVLSRELPPDLFQIHSRDYRNPSQLPPGAALVVGSGASGTQIAEELHHSGRRVILAVGRFHKTPVGIEDAISIVGSTSLAIGTRRLRPCLQM
jgi:putative flavoprotein involved in K+ transport